MREHIVSTVSRGQMVIPKSVQKELGVKPGDRVRYSVKGNKLEIEKLSDNDSFDPFSAFTEWTSDEDEKAFADLKPKKR